MKTPKDAGLVYRALKGLEVDGAVRSHWDHSDPGPARRVYALTEAGAEQLEGWRVQLTRELEAIQAFLKEYERAGRRSH